MRVSTYHELAELERWKPAWDRLADGCVFRSWTWLAAWWRHYGGDAGRGATRRLSVIAAFDDDDTSAPAGILPAYCHESLVRGCVLRLMGDGEACSDHLGLLATPVHADAVAEAIAADLAERGDWDLLDLSAVDADDAATRRLHATLADAGCVVSEDFGERCWSIDLPGTWEEFLALQSKSHRKQLRQLERRVLDAGLATWELVERPEQFDAAWEILVDLHQRRRQSLGEPGCFASPRWAAFHRDVAAQLLNDGRLRLSHLRLDGEPVAAEYHLAGSRAIYAYQGGVHPGRLAEEPGRLSTIWSIQRAIAEKHSRFDFLRGDEPYKAHWRASPHDTLRLEAVPPRRGARLRRRAWTEARKIGRFAKQLTGIFD